MDPVFPIQQHRRLAKARAKVEALRSQLHVVGEALPHDMHVGVVETRYDRAALHVDHHRRVGPMRRQTRCVPRTKAHACSYDTTAATAATPTAASAVDQMENAATGGAAAITVLTGVHIDTEMRRSCELPEEQLARAKAMVTDLIPASDIDLVRA